VRLRPPLRRPGNIVCMAVNHMEDGTRAAPASLNAFHKAPGAIIGDGDTMGLPDVPATIFEGEAEPAVVIGRPAKRVAAAEVADPHRLSMRLWINGEIKQDFNTSDMAHPIPRCIAWMNAIHTLQPGDLLATGTNHRGLSAFMDGDRVELEGEGLGRLRIGVRDDPRRVWARETRLDRQDQGFDTPTPEVSGRYGPGA